MDDRRSPHAPKRVPLVLPTHVTGIASAANSPRGRVRDDFGHSRMFRQRTKGLRLQAFRNGASRARTGDLLGAIQALSQLSYSPAAGGF